MIKVATDGDIVLLNLERNEKMNYHLEILNSEAAQEIMTKLVADTNEEILVDCDEDTFLIQRDKVELHDKLILIWEKNQVPPISTQMEELLVASPLLFPMLAIDESYEPLMLAWGKRDSLEDAMKTGYGTYFSRSRNKKWVKGEESGHLQFLSFVYLCLDPFYVVYIARQAGAACHTGYYSCFFRQLLKNEQVEFKYKNKIEVI